MHKTRKNKREKEQFQIAYLHKFAYKRPMLKSIDCRKPLCCIIKEKVVDAINLYY